MTVDEDQKSPQGTVRGTATHKQILQKVLFSETLKAKTETT